MFRRIMLVRGLILAMVMGIQGCATLPSYRESSNAQLMAGKFLSDLQNQNYEDSYNFFSDNLRHTITLSQHVGLMRLLQNELGSIKGYKTLPINLPIPHLFLDEETFNDPFRGDGAIVWLYEIQYEKELVTARIEIKRENSQYLIKSFACLSDKIYNDEKFRDKVKALGIPVAEVE